LALLIISSMFLEKVQKCYTKKLNGLRDKPYNERLVECRLVSLELRRLRVDLVLCFKIVKSLSDLKFDDFFVLDSNTITRGHNYKLRAPRCHTACRRNFFSIRIIPVWYHLPYLWWTVKLFWILNLVSNQLTCLSFYQDNLILLSKHKWFLSRDSMFNVLCCFYLALF